MARKQRGDFGDPFGDDEVRPFLSGHLTKSKDDPIDLERMIDAMETLDARARTMSLKQLYKLQTKLGTAVRLFQMEVMKYITKPRATMSTENLEKVHGNPMDDAGLDERRDTTGTRKGNGSKFTKAGHAGGDKGDPFGEDTEK